MKNSIPLLFAFVILLFSCKEEIPEPTPPTFSLADDYYVIQEMVKIKDVSDADSYLWDFGNGTTSTQKIPDSFTYSTPGIYIIKLTTSHANTKRTIEKQIKVGQLYAYEVQLLSYVENYMLEGGSSSGPSEGNPDIYLEISTYKHSGELNILHKSEVRPVVSRGNLPLTFQVGRIPLGGEFNNPFSFSPFFKFYDQNSDKPDRLIAHNLVAGGSTESSFDKTKKEGYYKQQRGTDDWGSHIVVKFKVELP